MQFTKEKPKVPGWYWCKKLWSFTQKPNLVIVNIYKSNPLLKEADSVYYCGNSYTINDENFVEFAGPIEPPTEPEDDSNNSI